MFCVKYKNIDYKRFDVGTNFYIDLNNLLEECGNQEDVSQSGKAYCTLNHQTGIQFLPDFKDFFDSVIVPQIKQFKQLHDIDNEGIYVNRAWANKMFKGSRGRNHNHAVCDAVVVFYLLAEGACADFVITKEEKFGLFDSDIEPKNKRHIKTESGSMIIHSPDIWHTVSTHHSEMPRICLIFDLAFY
jgi:hypothetical protein